MDEANSIVIIFLAVVFLVSGLAKASGNEKGLRGTRDVSVSDGFARMVGIIEILSAVSLLLGLILSAQDPQHNLIKFGLATLWATMGGAMFFHFRANKILTGFPAFFLLTLISFALVTLSK